MRPVLLAWAWNPRRVKINNLGKILSSVRRDGRPVTAKSGAGHEVRGSRHGTWHEAWWGGTRKSMLNIMSRMEP